MYRQYTRALECAGFPNSGLPECFRSAPLHSNSAVNSVNLTAENPLRAQTKTVPLLPLKRLRLDGVTQPVQPRAEPVSVGSSRLPLVDELVNRVKAAERSLDFAT